MCLRSLFILLKFSHFLFRLLTIFLEGHREVTFLPRLSLPLPTAIFNPPEPPTEPTNKPFSRDHALLLPHFSNPLPIPYVACYSLYDAEETTRRPARPSSRTSVMATEGVDAKAIFRPSTRGSFELRLSDGAGLNCVFFFLHCFGGIRRWCQMVWV